MKKAPSQSAKAMRVRQWYAEQGFCWLSWEEGDSYVFATQPIEQAG